MVGKPVGHYGFLSRGCLQKETNSLKEMIFLDYQKNSDKDHCKYAGDKQRISIDPTSARIFRIATWTPLSIRSNTASANMTFNELCHEVIYQMGRIKSNRRSEIIITSPLYAGSHLWTIVDILEALNFEDAFKRSPEFEGHFLEGDSVLLKIT
ncbi:MAG: hypothetical protein HZA17_12115 [Nitrospirae bacterium]|nr:hypothetical protein [Nitrospirota bacterium]